MWSGNRGFDDVPDERAAFTMRYEDDVLVSCSASQNAFKNGFLRITGTEGEMKLEPAFLRPSELQLSRGEVSTAFDLPDVGEYYQMREEFDYFADCVLSGRDPPANGEHALVDMRAIEAVFEAAESGERVDLESA
jgi:xylose dehydrogenase (NAD/NADP)